MTARNFNKKWEAINKKEIISDEFSIFVDKGAIPVSQRQFNLFHYFELIKKIIEKDNCKRSLEIGCGRGTMSLYLKKYLNMDVTLVDVEDAAISLAKKNFKYFKVEGNFSVSSAEALPFEKEVYNVCVSIGLAEHFEDYSKVFNEQYRVLKHGGYMISLNIPKKKSIQFLNNIYRKILKISSNKKLKKDYYRNEDSPENYRKIAEKVGFKECEIIDVNSFPLFTPVSQKNEKRLARLYNLIYKFRGLFLSYPFRASRVLSQAHFLIAKK